MSTTIIFVEGSPSNAPELAEWPMKFKDAEFAGFFKCHGPRSKGERQTLKIMSIE